MTAENHSLETSIPACDTSVGFHLILLIYTRRKRRIKWLEAYQVSNCKNRKINLDTRNVFNFMKFTAFWTETYRNNEEHNGISFVDKTEGKIIVFDYIWWQSDWQSISNTQKTEKKVYPFPSLFKRKKKNLSLTVPFPALYQGVVTMN